MIVQCEHCSTRFKLDDSKMKDDGVRVRCSKCKHIFLARKEVQKHEEPDFDKMLSGLVTGQVGDATIPDGGVALPPEEPAIIQTAKASSAAEPSDVGTDQREEGPKEYDISLSGYDRFSAESDAQSADIPREDERLDVAFTPTPDWDLSDSLPDQQDDAGYFTQSSQQTVEFGPGFEATSSQEPGNTLDEPLISSTDDSVFSFSGNLDEKMLRAAAPAGEEKPEVPPDKADEPFGGVEWQMPGVSPRGDQHKLHLNEAPVFNLSENATPFGESPSPGSDSAEIEEELPPLSISSRKKRSSLSVAIVGLSALVILTLSAVGLYLMNGGVALLDTLGLGSIARMAGLEHAEKGSIVIRNAASEFITSTESGELFVVRGEALNSYNKPRASVQIKAIILDAKGSVIQNKTVYCGNPLTREQLMTLPVAKIEAAMGNQFGDSLSNMGVQPGQAIPFAVAFVNIPREAREFVLEVAGSTAAGQ